MENRRDPFTPPRRRRPLQEISSNTLSSPFEILPQKTQASGATAKKSLHPSSKLVSATHVCAAGNVTEAVHTSCDDVYPLSELFSDIPSSSPFDSSVPELLQNLVASGKIACPSIRFCLDTPASSPYCSSPELPPIIGSNPQNANHESSPIDSFYSEDGSFTRGVLEPGSDEVTPPRTHHEYRRSQLAKNRDSRRFNDEYDNPYPPLFSGVTVETNKRKRKTHVGPWRLGKTLGRGCSGRIRLCRHEETGQNGAVKIMLKERETETWMENGVERTREKWTNAMEREVIILKMIKHPHVVQMYDVWENGRELYLVLEYVEGGDLFDLLSARGKFDEPEAVGLFMQLLSGVDYCHSFNICHRDLKPENILIDKDNNIKIADFGFAALQPPGWKLARSCGTPHYAAPEIVMGLEYDGPPADIWSCGVILFALLAGRVPFDDDDARVVLSKVKAGKFRMPSGLSFHAKDLIWRMLEVDPRRRITMAEIWRHPLVTAYFDPEDLKKGKVSEYCIGQQLKSMEDIDLVILEGLRSLWHGRPAELIQKALLSAEPNQEKIFYVLLQKFRDEHMEHYNGKHREPTNKDQTHKKPKTNLSLKRKKTKRRPNDAHETLPSDLQETKKDDNAYRVVRPKSCLVQKLEDSSLPPTNAADDSESKAKRRSVCFDKGVESSLGGIGNGRPPSPHISSVYVTQGCSTSGMKSMKALPVKHKRGVLFNHAERRMSWKPEPASNNEGQWEDVDSPLDQSCDDLLEVQQTVKSKKEGLALKKKHQLSTASTRNLAIAPRIRPVFSPRKRAKGLQDDIEEEVRKVSKDLGDYCEAAFFPKAPPVAPLRPRTFSSVVLNETLPALEPSFSVDFGFGGSPCLKKKASNANSRLVGYRFTAINDTQGYCSEADGDELDDDNLLGDILGYMELPNRTFQVLKNGCQQLRPDNEHRSVSAPLEALPEDEEFEVGLQRHQTTVRQEYRGHRSVLAPGSVRGSSALSFAKGQEEAGFIKAHKRASVFLQAINQATGEKTHGNSQIENSLRITNRGEPPTLPGIGLRSRYPSGRTISCMSLVDLAGSDRRHSKNSSNDCPYRPRSHYVKRQREASANIGQDKKYEFGGNDTHSLPGGKKRNILEKLGDIFIGPATTTQDATVQERRFWSGAAAIGSKNLSGRSKDSYGSSAGSKFFRLLGLAKKEDSVESAQGVNHRSILAVNTTEDNLTRSYWREYDDDDNATEPIQYAKPGWLQRVLKIPPASHFICFRSNAIMARRQLMRVLTDWNWKKLGIVEVRENKKENTIRARVSRHNVLRGRPVSFLIEVRACDGNRRHNRSVARVIQETGSASSLARLVEEIRIKCRLSNLIIEDEYNVNEMVLVFREFPRQKGRS